MSPTFGVILRGALLGAIAGVVAVSPLCVIILAWTLDDMGQTGGIVGPIALFGAVEGLLPGVVVGTALALSTKPGPRQARRDAVAAALVGAAVCLLENLTCWVTTGGPIFFVLAVLGPPVAAGLLAGLSYPIRALRRPLDTADNHGQAAPGHPPDRHHGARRCLRFDHVESKADSSSSWA